MTGTERDSQRQRIYDAERRWIDLDDRTRDSELARRLLARTPYPTVEDCQAYVDAVLDRRFFRARWSAATLSARVYQKTHGKATGSRDRISLPPWARNEPTILHELSHALEFGSNQPWHGPAFAAVYLAVVGAESPRPRSPDSAGCRPPAGSRLKARQEHADALRSWAELRDALRWPTDDSGGAAARAGRGPGGAGCRRRRRTAMG